MNRPSTKRSYRFALPAENLRLDRPLRALDSADGQPPCRARKGICISGAALCVASKKQETETPKKSFSDAAIQETTRNSARSSQRRALWPRFRKQESGRASRSGRP